MGSSECLHSNETEQVIFWLIIPSLYKTVCGADWASVSVYVSGLSVNTLAPALTVRYTHTHSHSRSHSEAHTHPESRRRFFSCRSLQVTINRVLLTNEKENQGVEEMKRRGTKREGGGRIKTSVVGGLETGLIINEALIPFSHTNTHRAVFSAGEGRAAGFMVWSCEQVCVCLCKRSNPSSPPGAAAVCWVGVCVCVLGRYGALGTGGGGGCLGITLCIRVCVWVCVSLGQAHGGWIATQWDRYGCQGNPISPSNRVNW